ncbi:MAG: CoA pyrophosphatase [Bacillota bacterium]|nr:CoA pyrophosphatase [Bacillota bacterium]
MILADLVKKLSGRTPVILGSEQFTKFSILLPLIDKEDGIHVLFEVRAHGLRRQPGEICFPGGKIDPDDRDEKYTALRETIEELRISENQINNVIPLDFMVSPFGTIIYPFVGTISNPESINPNPSEVQEVFTVPLKYFQESQPESHKINYQIQPESNFPFHLIAGGENYNWQMRKLDEYFYHYRGKVIWGLTARLVRHFIELLAD